MSFPAPVNIVAASQSQDEEWVVTLTNGVVRKIERIDNTTHTRTELSADEYVGIGASYYAMYYLGIHDYANAVASGNTDLAQVYYQGMVAFFGAMGQK
jgi:hypothetical protein